MKLTRDEERALAFIAALLFLSAAIRLATLRDPVPLPGAGLDLAAHLAASQAALDSAADVGRPLAPDERVDLNRASAVELRRLPRVGDALARRIADDRERNGPFRSVDDLARVPGIGPATVTRLSPHLEVVGGPRTGVRPRAGAAAQRGPPPRTRAPLRAGVPPGASAADSVVSLNSAGIDALTALPGIGPALAARIVAYRDSTGPFKAVDSLVAVKGIGPATLARVRRRLRLW